MESYEGRAVSGGIAIGEIRFYKQDGSGTESGPATGADAELTRYELARGIAIARLNQLTGQAALQVGAENAQIFETQAMMLDDDDYNGFVRDHIRERGLSAESAVKAARTHFAALFAAMEDEYFRARANDIQDVSDQVIGILSGAEAFALAGPSIVAAEYLTPSHTVRLDRSKLLAFITREGSQLSHTAILARAMNIPALVGVDVKPEWDGQTAIVDGDTGVMILSPDTDTLRRYREEWQREQERQAMLQGLFGQNNMTKSGRRIDVYANAAGPSDIAAAKANDAGGIGLLRSEFLYLNRDSLPTEQELFEAYKDAVEAMGGKRVVIRTLDVGADKTADYLNLPHEENPALGCRGIRVSLDRPEILKTQLRAIYRAGAFGHVAVMYPMIISLAEVKRIRQTEREVEAELTAEGVPYAVAEHGIMIETPAAAIISDVLAGEVDFFSVGTNDLTQYTLAVDRQNAKLEQFYDPHHEAIFRLIQMVTENAHRRGIWVGVCGELGADPALTSRFIDMGIDELSVAPSAVLKLRKAIREMA